MKTFWSINLAAALAFTCVRAAEVDGDYTVLKVCQEDVVLHTSDNAEAGHIAYVVIEPRSERIVSVLVSGGVLAERVVAVPIAAVRFRGPRDITLVNVDRERLMSAPVIERERVTTTSRFEPALIERARTHFHVSESRRETDRPDSRRGEPGAATSRTES